MSSGPRARDLAAADRARGIVYDLNSATFWQCTPGYLVTAAIGLDVQLSDGTTSPWEDCAREVGVLFASDVALVVAITFDPDDACWSCLLTSRGAVGWIQAVNLRPVG